MTHPKREQPTQPLAIASDPLDTQTTHLAGSAKSGSGCPETSKARVGGAWLLLLLRTKTGWPWGGEGRGGDTGSQGEREREQD